MSVDVSASVVINRPRELVARYAANPGWRPFSLRPWDAPIERISPHSNGGSNRPTRFVETITIFLGFEKGVVT